MAEIEKENRLSSIILGDDKAGVIVEGPNQGSIITEKVSYGSGKSTDEDIDAINFEQKRATATELSFKILEKALNGVGIELDSEVQKKLGIIKSKNVYTNFGVLVSDQCSHSIRVNIFEGNSKTLFRERHEFTGSVLKQFDDVCNFIEAKYSKRFPYEAVKAAVSNAIIHRNYSFSGSILVNIFVDQIEILSIGGLISQITVDDILAGICQPRNKRLADLFSLVNATESYGAGMQTIISSYRNIEAKPSMKITDNLFVIKLPNRSSKAVELTEHEKKIMNYILSNTSITRKKAEEILGVSQTMAGRVLRQLVEKEMLRQIGGSVNRKYIVNV
ncbi:MAG: ATP-binding protein [Eubacteriales bacterium]|nr:ATP-binding protein [Eubacteriales bacterium]